MKKLTTFVCTFLLFAGFTSQAKAHNSSGSCERPYSIKKIGDFRIIGKGQWKSFLLDNNKVYHPTKSKYKKMVKMWNVGDRVRMYAIRKSCKSFYVLNLRTGRTIKASILRIKP